MNLVPYKTKKSSKGIRVQSRIMVAWNLNNINMWGSLNRSFCSLRKWIVFSLCRGTCGAQKQRWRVDYVLVTDLWLPVFLDLKNKQKFCNLDMFRDMYNRSKAKITLASLFFTKQRSLLVTNKTQKKSYFFHRKCQHIQGNMCRLHSHGHRGLHFDTGTARYSPAHNCHLYTLNKIVCEHNMVNI